MDQQLNLSDLHRLNQEYGSHCSRWYDIGCALRINPNDLDAIEKDQRGKCEDCFREVLAKWLRKEGKKAESELIHAIQELDKGL